MAGPEGVQHSLSSSWAGTKDSQWEVHIKDNLTSNRLNELLSVTNTTIVGDIDYTVS